MSVTPLSQTPGIPDEFIQALNSRFRQLHQSASVALAAAVAPLAASAGSFQYGTHAVRTGSPARGEGSIFIETDRNNLEYQTRAGFDVYAAGAYAQTQSQLAALGTSLGLNDTGLLVDVTDYAHRLRWTGAAFVFADASDPPGRVQGFLVDPVPTAGWQLCDGSATAYLNPDGTTTPVTLPDLVSATNKAAYLKFGSPAGTAAVAAIAPGLVMHSYTPAGAIGAQTFTGSSVTTSSVSAGTPAGTVSAPTFAGSAQAITSASVFAATGATTALTGPASITPVGTVTAPSFTGSTLAGHSHTVTAAGTVSAGTLTGTPAVLTGTIDATGEPQNLILRPWFRR